MGLVIEAPVAAADLDLNYGDGGAPPGAHASVRRLGCDSDGDEEDEDDPDDGTGAALDYILQRLKGLYGAAHRSKGDGRL